MSDVEVGVIDILPEYRQKLGDFNAAIQQSNYRIYDILEDTRNRLHQQLAVLNEWYETIERELKAAESELEDLYADEEADEYEIAECEARVDDLRTRRDKMSAFVDEAENHLQYAQADIEQLDLITRRQSLNLSSAVQQGQDYLERVVIPLYKYKQTKSRK